MKTYKTISMSEEYSSEIYDGCRASFEMRKDGKRARLVYDCTYWHGNTGGLTTRTVYFDNARGALKAFRNLQIDAIKEGADKYHFRAFLELAELADLGYIQ